MTKRDDQILPPSTLRAVDEWERESEIGPNEYAKLLENFDATTEHELFRSRVSNAHMTEPWGPNSHLAGLSEEAKRAWICRGFRLACGHRREACAP